MAALPVVATVAPPPDCSAQATEVRADPKTGSTSDEPRPGAPGADDPYYPDAGNGGTDALLYDLDIEVDMDSGAIEARAIVELRALHALSSFSLDLVGLDVAAVQIDGSAAEITRAGRELIITPAEAIPAASTFRCEVKYSGVPTLAPDRSVAVMGLAGVGWWKMDTGIYTISECVGAASWFPCNDHPADKARLRLRVTVDEPWVVAANGVLIEETRTEREDGSASRSFQFEARDPMATYLATVNIARFAVRREEGPGGLPLTLYYPEDAEEAELAAFSRTGEMLTYFEKLFGPYPFECFGGVLSYEAIGGALETQTLPVYSRGTREGTVAHELAHQWFGNAVSLERWEDLWLNEGFASYAEWLWREHTQGREAMEKRARGAHSFLRRRKVGAPHDPGVEELWSARAYQRGAWVLHALRTELGDEAFFKLCREWVSRNLHANASTADFVALAEEVAGRELDELFASWLYGDVLPELQPLEAGEQGGDGGGR